jgi:hypothetical protein
MRSDVEVENPAAIVTQVNEHEQHLDSIRLNDVN